MSDVVGADHPFDLSFEVLRMELSGKMQQYMRILRLTRKPSREEFTMIAKVAGAGLLLIGMVGFIIYLLMVSFPKMLLI